MPLDTEILIDTMAVATGNAVAQARGNHTYQASLKGTGSISATVVFDVRNAGPGWILGYATYSLSGSNQVDDGFTSDEHWAEVRVRVTAINGTDARVVASLAQEK